MRKPNMRSVAAKSRSTKPSKPPVAADRRKATGGVGRFISGANDDLASSKAGRGVVNSEKEL